MKFSSCLPFRKVAAFMLGLILAVFLLPLFNNPSVTSAALSVEAVSLEAVLQPAKNGVYGVELKLNSPIELKVGDFLTLGPRSGDTIKSFALGWLTSSKVREQCQGLGEQTTKAYYVCPGADIVEILETSLRQGEVVIKEFGVGTGLAGTPGQGDTVVPVLIMQNGDKLAWVGVSDIKPGQEKVLACVTTIFYVCPPGTNALDNFLGVNDAILSSVNDILSGILGFFNEAIFFVFSHFIGPGIEALLAIRTYKDEFAAPIFPAWKVLRNFSNILFILAIIAIGIVTVFRIGGWQAKDMLVRLIIGAIFINFSLVIAQTILGVADTLQNTFLPTDTGALRLIYEELFVNGKSLFIRDAAGNIIGFRLSELAGSATFGTFQSAVIMIFGFMVSFGAFIAFIALWFFLLIRIIALWILLMVSPLAYAAMALPLTRGITRRWWSNFIKYAFMTPVVAFMINLTALIAKNQREIIFDLTNGQTGILAPAVSAVMYSVISQAVVIAFLFATIKVASKFGAESGGYIDKVSEKGWRSAVGGMKKGTGYNAAKSYGLYKADVYKSKYLEAVSKFAPKEEKRDAAGNIIQRKSGGVRRFVYDQLSGGAVTEARSQEGKSLVSTAQRQVKGRAEDYRNLVLGKALTASQYLELAAENEKIREHAKVIENQNISAIINDSIEDIKSRLDTQGTRTRFMAQLDAILAQKGGLDKFIKDSGAGDIEGVYGMLAHAGLSEERLNDIRSKINGKAIADGRLDNVVDSSVELNSTGLASAYAASRSPTTGAVAPGAVGAAYTPPTPAAIPGGPPVVAPSAFGVSNEEKRRSFWQAKSATDQAGMHKNVMFNLDKTNKYGPPLAPGGVATAANPNPAPVPGLQGSAVLLGANDNTADFFKNFVDKDAARLLVGDLSTEKKDYLRELLKNPAVPGSNWLAIAAQLRDAGYTPAQQGLVFANLSSLL